MLEPLTPTPTHIGPYHILDTLGEGGMGIVYLAEQTAPVKRKVALKLIKLGMDSKAVQKRFEQERQALALMAHDGIAKVLDCGTSERGQPFFVMELVKGVPLTRFCDQHQLSLPERLALLQQVCAAVTHAHQKGVVHRDLKPGNVLVSEEQGRLQIKIIDFGLAKAMGQKLVEATLFTEAGQVIGTPEYMAPEQADPTNQDIDTRADVYSLGVLLYELLVGELPFSAQELRTRGLLEMQRVLREIEPAKPSTKLTALHEAAAAIAAQRRTTVQALHRVLKNDLDWVVLKALEKDRARRYDTANALAMDLRRYLENEPLLAGPPSTGYRLRKLMRKYRGQVAAGSAVLATAVVGAIVALSFAITAHENEVLATQRAEQNATLAHEKGRLAAELGAKVREFDQLAGVVDYESVLEAAQTLYPPWPQQIEAMQRWLREDAGRLLAKRPDIERTVHDLEQRALPATAADLEADRLSHPRCAELESATRRVASLQRAQAIRLGQPLVVPELPADFAGATAAGLNSLAWARVAPPAKEGNAEERAVFGEEALGLACARAAVARAGPDEQHAYLDTLAWALFANGQDAAARTESEKALRDAPGPDQPAFRGYLQDLETAIANAAGELAAAEQQLRLVTEAVGTRRTFRFELESQRFLHDTLADLLQKLDWLAHEQQAVRQALSWASQIDDLTLAHPNARHTWGAVRAAIAKADDIVASRRYAGRGIELRDQDVTGLVPIGMNPVTKLWEFYELRSAWDGSSDPQRIAIPEHDAGGRIQVGEHTGIVFVLLPGGTFAMGAQGVDPNSANYDEHAQDFMGPVHEVTLAPFFLARHELTQGQWSRLCADEQREPSQYRAGMIVVDDAISLANPVEQVDWSMCDQLLWRQGLTLPTEAQWEYACRAGSTTPWSCPLDSLARHANLADAAAKLAMPAWNCETWSDGFAVHTRVGSFGANAFGLHDMHGNVWEWCLDEHGDYSGPVRAADGLRLQGNGSSDRSSRGGSFFSTAASARSADRSGNAPATSDGFLGCRPARALRR
ncbi:MAG TPA: bifunctional serine/threonine-protein kinase/formylglycine-generating enzyme family protein [Planctomycetota bacterium]|nr:bifunctional serine/threonine-protein kinase/formylglycine-generating enzyme family protein [Planctomycetota bacterium]